MFGYHPIGSEPFGAAPVYVSPSAPTREKCLFLSSREISRATIVGSTEVSTLPASYLLDMQPQKKWRLTSKVDQYLQLTLYRPIACNTVAFVASNFTSAAVVRILASNDLATITSAPEFNSGWKSAWPASGKPSVEDWPSFTCLVRFQNTTAYRYWRIEFADPGGETTYMEVGRLMIDLAFQPTFNVDVNPGLGLTSADAKMRTAYNRTYTDPRGEGARVMRLPFTAVNATEFKRQLFELQRYCGLAKDFVFSLDPAATSDLYLYTLQGVFNEAAQFEAQPYWDREAQLWRTSISLTEPI